MKKDIFKKPINYVFVCLCVAAVAMFVYALVNLCLFSAGKIAASVSNIVQMIFSIVCILALSIYVSIVRVARLRVSDPIGILFLISIFLLFGVYPCFDLFASYAATVVVFVLMGIVFSVLSISVFFAFSKRQDETVHANTGFMLTFMLLFETFTILAFSLILHLSCKASGQVLLGSAAKLFELVGFSWIGFATVFVVTWLSLIQNKKFVNLCLVTKISD